MTLKNEIEEIKTRYDKRFDQLSEQMDQLHNSLAGTPDQAGYGERIRSLEKWKDVWHRISITSLIGLIGLGLERIFHR